jgi:hypothetical protein
MIRKTAGVLSVGLLLLDSSVAHLASEGCRAIDRAGGNCNRQMIAVDLTMARDK